LVAALRAAGFNPAVVSRQHQSWVPGVCCLHPADALPPEVDLVVWADKMTAADFSVFRTAAAAGLDPSGQLDSVLRTGTWVTGGQRYAAAIRAPSDDGLFACWQVECWRELDQMLAGNDRVAVIVLDNVPACNTDVELLFHSTDAAFSDAGQIAAFVAAVTGTSAPEAASATLDVLVGHSAGGADVHETMPLTAGQLRLAEFLATIKTETQQ
jgi:hypothetical protein